MKSYLASLFISETECCKRIFMAR